VNDFGLEKLYNFYFEAQENNLRKMEASQSFYEKKIVNHPPVFLKQHKSRAIFNVPWGRLKTLLEYEKMSE
jgi:hypothetical protein